MRTVWHRLLDRVAMGDSMARADDVRRWDQGQWREILNLGLLREMELDTAVLCDQCGEAHWADIHWVAPGERACYGCPTEGVIDIEIDRLRQWRIDADRLAQLLATSLDLSSPVECLRHDCLWRLGRRRIGGRFRDLFLGVSGNQTVFELSGSAQASIGRGSALILTVGCDVSPTGIPAEHHLLELDSVSHVGDGRVILDLDYLEDHLVERRPAQLKTRRSILAPSGTGWEEVSITVFDEMLHVAVGGKLHEVDFSEIGVDLQSQPIQLLRLFAAARGTLDVTKAQNLLSGDSQLKVRMARLRQVLMHLVPADGDPFRYRKKAQTYTCQFSLRLADDHGLRVPHGTSWLDLAFHERADGRIVISVPEKRRFSAYGSEVKDKRTGETAESIGMIGRTYSLEEMGLRSSDGAITKEGDIFLALLRASGNLPRSKNEMFVLKLASQLRHWTQMEGEPFLLARGSTSWTAVFACSSTVAKTTS